MSENAPGSIDDLDPEDRKLATLARSTRLRHASSSGAAVRDQDGRTYTAAAVQLPSLTLSALQVAVAMAVSSGASELEAAVVVSDSGIDEPGVSAVRDVSASAPVFSLSDNDVVAVQR